MDTILLAMTAFSLALAVGMGVVLFKLTLDERRRSDARVALLTAAAPPIADPLPIDAIDALEPESAGLPDVSARGLFTPVEASSPWEPRVAVAGAIALIALTAFVMTRGSSGEDSHPAASPLPLHLMSLHHSQEPGALTVTGLVRNPRGAAPVTNVFATASLFAANGTLLASGRAQLDYIRLAPGDESPFVIKVSVAEPVARYRVGFRGADGTVIAHVDRRSGGASARNERIPENEPWVH